MVETFFACFFLIVQPDNIHISGNRSRGVLGRIQWSNSARVKSHCDEIRFPVLDFMALATIKRKEYPSISYGK